MYDTCILSTKYILLWILLIPSQAYMHCYYHAFTSMINTMHVYTHTEATDNADSTTYRQRFLCLRPWYRQTLHNTNIIISKYKSANIRVFQEYYCIRGKLAAPWQISRQSFSGNKEAIPVHTSWNIILLKQNPMFFLPKLQSRYFIHYYEIQGDQWRKGICEFLKNDDLADQCVCCTLNVDEQIAIVYV